MTNGMRRCECSSLMVRNNDDGSQDFKVEGKTGCLKCRGYGYVESCGDCAGTGMIPRAGKCGRCWGTGMQAVKDL